MLFNYKLDRISLKLEFIKCRYFSLIIIKYSKLLLILYNKTIKVLRYYFFQY